MLRPGVTQEWVDKGELPRERKKKSEKTKALCCVGKSHTWRSRSPSSSHENLYAMEMSLGVAGELDCFSAHIRLREPDMSEDKADGVEAGGRKGRGSDDESSGAQLPKSKASVRKEVDSEEHHSAIEAYLPIVKEGCRCKVTDSRAMGLATPWYAEKSNGSGKVNHSRSFPSSEGSARTNKDQHNSANPTPDSVIGELKQHGGLEFDYSTTMVGSQKGMLQPKQKIEDSTKCKEMQLYSGFDEDVKGISGGECNSRDAPSDHPLHPIARSAVELITPSGLPGPDGGDIVARRSTPAPQPPDDPPQL
ncbi:hypothetical protein BHE74_00054752 [Ensete ventricosum]|nr:hypothetical protein BHE74_00054752 [Ensete ventricosum]